MNEDILNKRIPINSSPLPSDLGKKRGKEKNGYLIYYLTDEELQRYRDHLRQKAGGPG